MKTNERKSIYVLCTGGTISMQRTDLGYAPASGHLALSMAKFPELNNPDMPFYTIEEYVKPIDSANMTPEHWMQMADLIFKNYELYDGFVILHGTDTMAYTASALSFILENLNKPVILTGSQLPLFETRNDARENLINAMLLASHSEIAEVCLYFNNKLFRGNRCKKTDATSFAAFTSPNFPALAKIGTEVLVRKLLLRKKTAKALEVRRLENTVIGAFRLFPGMSLEMLTHYLQAPLQALVLETYGLGNAPENENFLKIISQACKQGIVIVNCSQCPTAKVRMGEYVAGTSLRAVGVISGGDMTAEAALAKLFYLFSLSLPIPQIKEKISHNLRGELTV